MRPGSRSVRGRWFAAWLGGAAIGVANGLLREGTYGRHLSEAVAHQVSTVTAIGAFSGYFLVLQRVWPIPSEREAREIGAGWLGLTIAFEFGFGRVVASKSWGELFADYTLARGRTWPLVLAWLGAGPSVIRRLGAGGRRSRELGRW